jgi:hypothetical protein
VSTIPFLCGHSCQFVFIRGKKLFEQNNVQCYNKNSIRTQRTALLDDMIARQPAQNVPTLRDTPSPDKSGLLDSFLPAFLINPVGPKNQTKTSPKSDRFRICDFSNASTPTTYKFNAVKWSDFRGRDVAPSTSAWFAIQNRIKPNKTEWECQGRYTNQVAVCLDSRPSSLDLPLGAFASSRATACLVLPLNE